MKKPGRHLSLLLLCGLIGTPAHAHKPSDSYLTLTVDSLTTMTGRWDIALRDLEHVVGLDANADAAITWGELKSRRNPVFDYALQRLTLATGDNRICSINGGEIKVVTHTDGAYAVLYFRAECPMAIETLAIDYRLLFKADPSHRGLLQVRGPVTTHGRVLGSDTGQVRIALGETGIFRQLASFLLDGIWHLLKGLDHILFLATLLLPAVLIRKGGRWQGRAFARPAVIEIVKLATAFTVAHSITLSLAVLGVMDLPSRLVESLIALSVCAMALNNIWPVLPGARWLVAFVFGLVHGFGFASVLTGLGLPAGSQALALLGFNLGVEVGQLLIIALFLPVALRLRHNDFYQKAILQGGSALIALVGAYWFIERAFSGA